MTQNYLVNKPVTVLAWKSESGEDGQPGYNVKDEAGNVTWKSEEEFLKDHLPLGHYDGKAPHVQRMVIEKAQLTYRVGGLKTFLLKVRGGERPEGLSDYDVSLLEQQEGHMRNYGTALDHRISRATARRFTAKSLSLKDSNLNLFAVGQLPLEITDVVGTLLVTSVRTTDGLELSYELERIKQVEGQRTENLLLNLPGAQPINFKLDRERASLAINVPSSIKTELVFDLEIGLDNHNHQCS